MGNPKASVSAAPPSIDSGNGIFALVPGEYIAAGAQTLPPPQTMPGQTVQVEADGGHVGRIVITYVSHSYRHHKSTHWHWRPQRVDRASAEP